VDSIPWGSELTVGVDSRCEPLAGVDAGSDVTVIEKRVPKKFERRILSAYDDIQWAEPNGIAVKRSGLATGAITFV